MYGVGGASEGRRMTPGMMHDVRAFGLKCATCGADIEELPFLPLTSTRPVYCAECNSKRKPASKKTHKGRSRNRRR